MALDIKITETKVETVVLAAAAAAVLTIWAQAVVVDIPVVVVIAEAGIINQAVVAVHTMADLVRQIPQDLVMEIPDMVRWLSLGSSSITILSCV